MSPKRPYISLFLGLGVASPACHTRQSRAELAEIERRYSEDAATIDGIALDLERLTVTQRQVLATYGAAKREWETASILYQESTSRQEMNAETLKRAAADFEVAERQFRTAALAMVTIAAGSIICAGTVSTQNFRKQLADQGVPVDRFQDIDHIFPRSRGGIDHPLNYQVLDRSLNRSLGNKVVEKFMQAPLGFVTGLAVSALGVIGGCN